MIIDDISKLQLHDEIILEIEIKSINDYFDHIYIRIKYNKQILLIECSDCFSTNINCNMNIVGNDSIRNIWIENVTKEIPISLYPKKVKFIECKKISIITNITNSVIEIIAKNIFCSLK